MKELKKIVKKLPQIHRYFCNTYEYFIYCIIIIVIVPILLPLVQATLDDLECYVASLERDFIHKSGNFDVLRRETAAIMRRHCHLHFIVDIEPFRMMIHLIGKQRDSSHETKGFVEILKDEFLVDRIATLDHLPAIGEQWIQQLSAFLLVEFCLQRL